MRCAIGVVVHNGLEFVRPCLESVIRHTLLARRDDEIIVVDNGSTEPVRSYLLNLRDRHTQQGFRLVSCEENLGYGAGQNLAWATTQVQLWDFFVALNSDVKVLSDDWLEPMIEAFRQDDNLALCGPDSGYRSLWDSGRGYAGGEAEYVEGWCLAARTSVLRQWGFFDSLFEFCYCEDADLSLRLRSKGYNIAHVPVPVKHIGGATTCQLTGSERQRLVEAYYRNHELLRARWGKYLKTRTFDEQ